MKNIINTLLVSTVILGGTILGLSAHADQTSTNGHVNFDKGELTPLPIDPEDPEKPGESTKASLPTFDFGEFVVGVAKENQQVLAEGEESKSEGLTTTGVGNFSGDDKAWSLSVKVGDFKSEGHTDLSNIIFDFKELSAMPASGGDKLKNNSINTVTTGKEAAPIFTTDAGEVAAGKFVFDYTKTKLTVPSEAANKAKVAGYKSDLTWVLAPVNDTMNAQISAVPSK